MRAWYFYLAEISLWRLETSAKHDITKIATSGSDENRLQRLTVLVDKLSEHLKSWQSTIPSTLSLDEDAEGRDSCVLRFVLRGRLTYNHELLTWPFLHAAIHDSHHTSPVVERLSRDACYFHIQRLAINKPGYFHRHHGTWLMMRSSARSACIVLATALTPHMAWFLPYRWTDTVLETVEMLEYWNTRGGRMEGVAALLRREVEKMVQISCGH